MQPNHLALLNPASKSAVAALRAATAQAHHQLDNESRLNRLSANDLQKAELVDLLRRLLLLHEAVERLALWPERTLGPDADVPRTQLLRSDLFALTGCPAGLTEQPGLDMKPRSDDPAFLAGYLYVIEGSRLGGAVIRRRLLASLGPSAEGFTSFFGSGGAQAGSRWRKVCEYLDATLKTKQSVEMASEGAIQAYSWFLNAFQRAPQPALKTDLQEPEVHQ